MSETTGIALPGNPDKTILEALLASPHAEDHVTLRRVFSHTRWRLLDCERVAHAVELINTRPVAVVISRELLLDGTWQDLVSSIESATNPPKLLLAAAEPTKSLWQSALSSGADSILHIPFDANEALRSIAEASQRWWFTRVREKRFDIPAAERRLLGVNIDLLEKRPNASATHRAWRVARGVA